MSKRGDDDRDGYPVGRGEDSDDSLGRSGDGPLDLGAVQADDAFLDMLGRADAPIGNETDAELARLLVAWRREVDSEPPRELVSTDTAITVLNSARRGRAPRRHPVLAPLAAAAAVLVIAFSAVGLVAKSAKPGDQLFGLTEVLYADYARSVKAAYQVQTDLERARLAFEQGRPAEAQQSLDRAEEQLEVIAPDTDERTDLIARYEELRAMMGDPDEPGSPGGGGPGDTDSGDDPAQPVPPTSSASSKPSDPSQTDPPTSTRPSPTSPTSSTDQPDPGSTEPTPRSGAPDSSDPEPGPDPDPGPGPGPDPDPDPGLPSPSVPDGP